MSAQPLPSYQTFPALPPARDLPRALLYSTSARIGGSGLDVSSLEGIKASAGAGFLKRAIGYANQQQDIPAARIRSLAWHPVRLLSGLGSARYYGAKNITSTGSPPAKCVRDGMIFSTPGAAMPCAA